ncbi:MAG: ABC transporter ATP-binding protein [Clostridiales bacterium]|nr:ABC transporter ATP-binding protein [Clostridiales bacterium]
MLKIQNLSKSYQKGTYAVKNLSLNVKSGEIYGFVGHNGAGKSTAIKSIVGALGFDAGEILINGNSIKDEPIKAKKDMAYIPDNPDIYEYLTGIQYINFVCDIYGVGDERNEKIEKYATDFQIKENLGDLISTYSHGMKQKLVLISALVHSPKLLVLDEPFVGLDPIASFRLKEIMKELCSNGSAIFFSSHVLEVVEKLCDRVGIIKKGELVKEGKMQEIIGDKSLEKLFLEIADE